MVRLTARGQGIWFAKRETHLFSDQLGLERSWSLLFSQTFSDHHVLVAAQTRNGIFLTDTLPLADGAPGAAWSQDIADLLSRSPADVNYVFISRALAESTARDSVGRVQALRIRSRAAIWPIPRASSSSPPA